MGTPMQPETLETAAVVAGAGDSTSISVIETANGSHRFEIKGYSLSKGMGSGKYIASDVFSVGGYDWAIYFYPDGKNPEDNSIYVSVFIALASEGSDIRALFELTLLDQSGKGKHKVHSHFDRALESGPYTLKYRGSMWGYKRFLRRSALEASDFIKDDCLVMQCMVGVVRFHNNGPKLWTIPVPPSDICDNYKSLFESEMGCDVVFIVGDESFKAHKVVLACRSPVFKAQFFGIMGDPNVSEIVVEDIVPFIFKGMLHFIYTDTLPDVSDSMDCSSLCISTLMMQHLLAAADRYDLSRLKLLCESKLAEEINHKTVATTLAVADRHHCLRLKTICLKFIASKENLIGVMQTDGFKQVTEDCPSLLEDLLKILALAGENQGSVWTRKRSASSVFGQEPNEAPTESVNLDGRRIRRHVE